MKKIVNAPLTEWLCARLQILFTSVRIRHGAPNRVVMKKETELDDIPLGFGKYAKHTPNEIAGFDMAYIVWMYDNVHHRDTCTEQLRDACEEYDEEFDEYEAAKEDEFHEMNGWK